MNEMRRERDAKILEEKAKAKKDPFTCHKEVASTEEERDALRKQLERDRLEMAAELAHRGPTQASKALASESCKLCTIEKTDEIHDNDVNVYITFYIHDMSCPCYRRSTEKNF